jgi:hypothetical protein
MTSHGAWTMAILMATLTAPPLLAATPPVLVNYQGVVRNAAGSPLTGNQDMVFTFYSASTGGTQIMIDSHTTANGNYVSAANGLFTVSLGLGTITDGSGAGTYTDLGAVFRDYQNVYVEIKTNGETMDPRIRILAAAYSLNADNLDGVDSSGFAFAAHTHSTYLPLTGGTMAGNISFSGPQTIDGIDLSSSASTWNNHVLATTNVHGLIFTGEGHGGGFDADSVDGVHGSELMPGTQDDWVNENGDTMTGKLTTAASTTTRAGLTLPHGTAPSAPVNGDLWTTTSGLYARISGITTGPFGSNDHGSLLGLTDDDHPQYFNLSQSETVTGTPAFNGGTSGSTAPFTVDSTYMVTNLNADYLDGQTGTYYLNTSSTAQTKNGKVTFTAATGDYGVEGWGPTAGGYFHDATGTGYANIGYGDWGIYSFGNTGGGYFETTDPAGTAWAAAGRSHTSGFYGIRAGATTSGGYFWWEPGSSSNRAYAHLAALDPESSTGNYGVFAYGTDVGGQFSGLTGIVGKGGVAGGSFTCSTYPTTQVTVADGAVGISSFGAFTGGYFDSLDSGGSWAEVATSTAKITGTGSQGFIQNNPEDPESVFVYMGVEGDEVATYTRGTARLVNGEARVPLGETYKWVTNPDIGLTVYLTPVGKWADLYVASKSTREIVVKSRDEGSDAVFDYIVYGLRIGFEEATGIRPKKHWSPVPSMTEHETAYAAHPEWRAYAPLERFKAMERQAGLRSSFDLSASEELRATVSKKTPHDENLLSREVALRSRNAPRATESGSGLTVPDAPRAAEGRAPAATPLATPFVARGDDQTAKDESPRASRHEGATPFPIKEAVDRGDVLVLNPANGDELFKCVFPADPMVVGIAAEAGPAMGNVRVIQYGTTWVKADASALPIARGDLLTASSTLGHAMKALDSRPGTIIGKALEPLQAGTGLIRVLVMMR